jgi:hypothetical protein
MNRVAVPAGVVGKRAAVPRMFTKPMNDRPMPMAKHLEGLLATFDQRVPDSAGMLLARRGTFRKFAPLQHGAKEAREDQWDSCGGS